MCKVQSAANFKIEIYTTKKKLVFILSLSSSFSLCLYFIHAEFKAKWAVQKPNKKKKTNIVEKVIFCSLLTHKLLSFQQKLGVSVSFYDDDDDYYYSLVCYCLLISCAYGTTPPVCCNHCNVSNKKNHGLNWFFLLLFDWTMYGGTA